MTRSMLVAFALLLAGCAEPGSQPPPQEHTQPTPSQALAEVESPWTVIGAWSDERPYASSHITFEQLNDELRIHRKFFDGSQSDAALEEIPALSGKRFREPDDSNPDEYYVVNGQGDLEIWDKQGLVTTARKVD